MNQAAVDAKNRRTFLVFGGITFVLVIGCVVLGMGLFQRLDHEARERTAVQSAQYDDRKKLVRLFAAVTAFREKHGALPKSLGELRGANARDYFGTEPFDALFVDAWGRDFLIAPDASGFRVYTLGRDGAPGGEDADRDLSRP
ncbi:MAG: type II secretion system protein GspG [Planctomycetes bacterium]|nr:type II secretion system protein GspG [Planctomycetota bacterium]